jgi:signal transduction histidine kinase
LPSASERRATLAEREQEAAARIAVAEERARIARALHDIVAHAMSVMVLQVGAVRHKLSHTLEEDRDALARVEQAGRTALAEMRRLLGAMRSDGDGVELGAQVSELSWRPPRWRASVSSVGFTSNSSWRSDLPEDALPRPRPLLET